MFDKERSYAFVFVPKSMNKRRIPVFAFHPLLEWYEQLHHFGVSSISCPHERSNTSFVSWVLVRNNDLGGFYVPTPESPVERCGSGCPSFLSHVQEGPLPLPCDSLVQQSQAQSYHQHLSPALVEAPPGLGHVPRAAARMRAVSPSEEGLFTADSALASTSLRPAGPSSDILA